MFGGDAFGSQSFGSAGNELAEENALPSGVSIDDICTEAAEAGVAVSNTSCDCCN